MNEQAIEKSVEEKTDSVELNVFIKAIFTLCAAFGSYLLISTHYLFCVRLAHLLGDATYIPPSVLRFTGVVFRDSEVGAFVQIVFFVFWLIVVIASCVLIFMAASFVTYFVISNILSDEALESAVGDCLANGFICLVPVLALSLLTLLIMPLESTHLSSESESLSQIGALMPFSEFLFTMTEATMVIFLVCFFVVITVTVAYLLSFFWDSDFSFFVWIFVGVCVGLAMIFGLGHFLHKGIEFIKIQTDNAYLTLYTVFAVYAFVCTILIFPSTLKTKKELREEELKEKLKDRKQSRKRNQRNNQANLRMEN